MGKVDRAAVIKEINTGSFDTIIGKVKLENGLNKNIWAVGQWQGADFFGVAPISKQGAKPVDRPSRRGNRTNWSFRGARNSARTRESRVMVLRL